MGEPIDPTNATQVQLDFINQRMDAIERNSHERLQAFKESVATSFAASERALNKAELANDKRFESVNEFRSTLSDQNQTFLRTDTYNTAHTALIEKFDILNNQVIALNSVYHQAPAPITGLSFFLGVGSVGLAFIIAIITGAIQLGAVQTQVAINASELKEIKQYNRETVAINSQQNSDISTIKTRQAINEGLISKIDHQIEALFQQIHK